MTNEQKVFETLEQKNFYVTLGGQQIEMSQLTLSMFDEMGALSSFLPIIEDVQDEKLEISSLIPLSGNGKILSEILFVSAKDNIKSDLKRKWWQTESMYQNAVKNDIERKKIALYDLIYNKTTFLELQTVIIQIFSYSNAFFLRSCITTLQGQNRLKQTKEIDQTAPTL